jgi:hypothetical protein
MPPPRAVFYVMPAMAVVAGAAGVIYGWIGVRALIEGGGWVGGLLLVFGVAGIALALALWNAWRLVTKRANGM